MLRRLIRLNPGWPGGLRSSASLRSPSDRSGSPSKTKPPNCIETNLETRGGQNLLA